MEDEHAFQSSEDEDDEDMVDSDEELQAAFARGDLKPGLVVMKKSEKEKSKDKPLVINNIPVLEQKLKEIKLKKQLGWVERLDIVNGPAPLAPELALQMDDHKTKREREIKHINAQRAKKKSGAVAPGQPSLKSVEEDPVHNDFLRETNFYRQAQEAILKCLPRLAELGVPTKRPEDYFAEMAKSDGHMQKVAKVLHKKQIATEKAEKVRKIREQKKIAKQTQVHVLQEKQKAKREFNENVKKYRKGQRNNLDFLEEKKGGRGGGQAGGRGKKPMVNRRRESKNEKYGYGGKKKGSKWNTRESLDSFGMEPGKKGGRGGGGGRGGRGGGRMGGAGGGRGGGRMGGRGGGGGGRMGGRGGGRMGGGGGGSKRPGKMSRQKMKAGKN